MLKKIKPFAMPLAMIIGALGYSLVYHLSFLTPYLIACMLFISYCNVSFKEIRFEKMHFWLLLIQIVGSIGVYLILSPFNHIVAEGAFICILAPTATSAVVITNMLGGNSASLTAYSILCNMAIAVTAPILFALMGDHNEIPFLESVWAISQNVFTLLFLPLITALLLDKFAPKIHFIFKRQQRVSFYLWSLALVIITGKIVKFIVDQNGTNAIVEITIGLLALVICIAQFVTGRAIGRKYNNTVAGGQGLGQKNTILAIWMAQSYLNPISSIGPGAYVLWQNIVNSYQVWRNRKMIF